jgi:hypothetical protein
MAPKVSRTGNSGLIGEALGIGFLEQFYSREDVVQVIFLDNPFQVALM